MAVRPILIYGDTRLHQKAEPVTSINSDTQEVIDDMFETLYNSHGVGLAATQLGINKSILIIDLHNKEDNEEENPDEQLKFVLINVEIIDKKGCSVFEEGCLSVPGIFANVERPEEITIRYVDRNSDSVKMQCTGLLARTILHEYDHLLGILFIQRLKPSIRKKLSSQLRKLTQGALL
jgi:peptide deformylase